MARDSVEPVSPQPETPRIITEGQVCSLHPHPTKSRREKLEKYIWFLKKLQLNRRSGVDSTILSVPTLFSETYANQKLNTRLILTLEMI